jgi:NAD(P)H-flavin reductase
LHEHLLSKPRGVQSIRVWTEGPHGHVANLKNFEHVLLIGGGIGITALLPYAQTFASSRTETQTMTLAYTAREPELVAVVKQILPGGIEELEIDIKVTESESMRMDLGAVIKREASKAGKSRLAVVVCGPAELADEVRREAVKVVGEGKRVELFEESFCW